MTKTLFAIALAGIVAIDSHAGTRIDAAAWRNVQTYDAAALLEKESSLMGRVVGIRFHYRSAKLRHLYPGWYEASLWQHDPKAKRGHSGVRVLVAKKDLPAFEAITSDFQSMADITLYGQIEKDPVSDVAQVRLIGRRANLDSAGNTNVDW
jgi:hypothetical protein